MPPKKNKKSETSAVRRVITYARVSTEKQENEGLSLRAQEERLKQYAAAMGFEIVHSFQDAFSASSLDRPGLQDALNYLDAGTVDALLIVKLDRLTRSVGDLALLMDEYFRDAHCLISVTESIDTSSAAGRMMLNVLTTIAQWEREAIGERTAAVMQHMKSSGMFTGGFPPYGYSLVDGELVESWVEQKNIKYARHARANGCSLREIAVALGLNGRTGKPYSASQISRML